MQIAILEGDQTDGPRHSMKKTTTFSVLYVSTKTTCNSRFKTNVGRGVIFTSQQEYGCPYVGSLERARGQQ